MLESIDGSRSSGFKRSREVIKLTHFHLNCSSYLSLVIPVCIFIYIALVSGSSKGLLPMASKINAFIMRNFL